MIDWLSIKVDLSLLDESVLEELQSRSSKLIKINGDGALDWTGFCWDAVRSDDDQVSVKFGSEFQIVGSPARVGMPNNVFGSLNIRYCAQKMINFVQSSLGLARLPALELWTCSRIDVTRNYLMQSGAEAKQAIEYLKQCPESRQKHSFESYGFYIGKGSSLQRGKIYLKGQDARRNARFNRAKYSPEELIKSDKLLRAELTLARHKIKRLRLDKKLTWHELTPELLIAEHEAYFKEYFSDIEVTDMANIYERITQVAQTEGRARAAYDCYCRIRQMGYEQAKISYTKSTWYRNIACLKEAGLKRADLQHINVIPLRKRAIEVSEPVRHWDDIPLSA